MDNQALLSENMQTVANALDGAVSSDRVSPAKKQSRTAQNYYDYKHDVLNNRIFYIDDNDKLQEDKYASNVKIPHPFFTELVDQKVQYLLSNPIELDVEDETFKGYLDQYYDDNFQIFLQEAAEGSSIKGYEYIFARTNSEDRLCFQVADSLQTFSVHDDNNEFKATVRYYDKEVINDNEKQTITHAEVWDAEKVSFFVTNKQKKFEIDKSKELNPRPHVIATDNDGKLLKRSYGAIPFYRLSNNKKEKTDLAPIKALIDDYDLMACFLSNNLQDFSDAIYVVKGYQGDDLSKLRQNLKAKKTVGVGENGDVSIQTVDIPVEARKTKLSIDKDAIYKFGMGFDSTQIGDGNITNVVIKSRYALLDMKANKAEVRLRAMLSWINSMIVDDINRRFNTAYNANDIVVNIQRETVVNETDIVANEKTEAETKQLIVQTILAAAPKLDDDSVLNMICDQFELNFNEVKSLIEEQDYINGLTDDAEPKDVNTNGGVGQVAEGAGEA